MEALPEQPSYAAVYPQQQEGRESAEREALLHHMRTIDAQLRAISKRPVSALLHRLSHPPQYVWSTATTVHLPGNTD